MEKTRSRKSRDTVPLIGRKLTNPYLERGVCLYLEENQSCRKNPEISAMVTSFAAEIRNFDACANGGRWGKMANHGVNTFEKLTH